MTNLDELRAQVELLRWCKEKKAEIKEVEATARAAIEAALGDDDTGTMDGHPVITFKFHKRNALDQQFLKKTFPDIYETCKRTTEVRRFEVLDAD